MKLLRVVTFVVGASCVAVNPLGAQQLSLRADSRPASDFRNPRQLDAVQVLEQERTSSEYRIRFEWDTVPGATQYLLSGKWTTPPSWTVQSREIRVTRDKTRQWDDEKILFDVSLPAGNHTWELVALFKSAESGDFEHPTRKSFAIK